MIDKAIAAELVRGKPWHHDFEIIPGVRTHGAYDPSGLWLDLNFPHDMNGLSLADVGASNGYFSFEARRRGARVVAFDVRHKDNSGFGLAQYINGLDDIEHRHVNILDVDPAEHGRFDVVLAMGLLYHTPDPLRALARCAALSQDRLFVESYCIDALLPAPAAAEPLVRFIPDPRRFPGQGQPNDDPSNFWGFTSACLRRLVEEVGFAVERSHVQHDRVWLDGRRVHRDETKTRLSAAFGVRPRIAVRDDRDSPSAWTVF